jgi:hypothetical protein
MKKLTALLIAFPLFAGGKAWMTLGYGTTDQTYNSDGEAVDMPYSLNVMNLRLGGMYDFYKLPTASFFGGVNFALSQHNQDPVNNGESVSSGFAIQNMTLFVGAKAVFVKAVLGFLLDMGPEADTEKIANTDEQNSILISFSGTLPNPMFSLSAGINYFMTMKKTKSFTINIPELGDTTITSSYDKGDHFALFVKGGYKFGIGEAGLEVLYKMRTTAKQDGETVEDSDGNHLSLIPYVYITPPAMPISFFIKGAVDGEYLPYGFSIMGKNDLVTRMGFTIGGVFKF